MLDTAQAALFARGLINIVVLDAAGLVLAADGARVSNWVRGDAAADRLMVLKGMEELIAAMATDAATVGPLELPVVFLGGNHEDGDPGLSLRLLPLAEGQVLLLLRPVDSTTTNDQRTVQQHNNLSLQRGQMEKAQSQAEIHQRTREQLFDTLKWGFRSPLAVLVQALDGHAELQGLAREALDAVDDWVELLALKTAMDDQHGSGEPHYVAMASVLASLRQRFAADVRIAATETAVAQAQVTGSTGLLLAGLGGLLRVARGELSLSLNVSPLSVIWRLEGIINETALASDFRWELARMAAGLLGGTLTISDQTAYMELPLTARR